MVELDLFKDWTPGMVEAFVYQRAPMDEEHRRKLGEAARKRWVNRSEEEKGVLLRNSIHSEETRRKAWQTQWGSYTPLEKEARLKRTIHSEEGREKARESFKTEVGKKRGGGGGEKQRENWKALSEEEKKIRLENSFHSPEGRRKSVESTRKFWENLSEEERRKFTAEGLKSASSPASRKKQGESLKSWWGNLAPEKKEEVLNNSILSDEAIRNKVKACNQRPTQPEGFMDRYQQRKHPGKWIYNGDYSQGVKVGLRIPDFIRADGTKEAISMMGSLGFGHFLNDEGIEIEYYKEHGWKCTVIWEWDVWDPEELNKIFGE